MVLSSPFRIWSNITLQALIDVMASANTHAVIAAHQVFHCSHSVTVHAHEVHAMHKFVLQEVVPAREPERRSGVSLIPYVERSTSKHKSFFKWLSGCFPLRRGPVARRNADEPELASNSCMTKSSPLPPLIDIVKEHCTRTTSGGVLDVTTNMYSISMMLVRPVPAPPSSLQLWPLRVSLVAVDPPYSVRLSAHPLSSLGHRHCFKCPGVSSESPFVPFRGLGLLSSSIFARTWVPKHSDFEAV